MITYSYQYQHKTKEVIINIQFGISTPVKAIVSAEAFIQDIEFIKKDPKLAHFLQVVSKRKDMPVDHDFGADTEIKFDHKQWDNRMGESQ